MSYFEINKPLRTFIPALRSILTSPQTFFKGLPPAAFYSNAIFFVSILIFIASFFSVPFHSMTLLFLLPVSWGLSLIGLFFWSKYMSWAVRVFAKSRLTTPNAFQISTYAATPLVLLAIPYVGWVSYLLYLWLLWISLVHRCKVKAGMAALVIAVPAVVFTSSVVVLLRLIVQMFPQLSQF